jgi:pyruvate,orthophosphate dikinase
MAEEGVEVDYKFGTMIETPRGAITAGELAEHAEFFSFGTNDLTQMSFGFSRDDAEGKFLLDYVERKILPRQPVPVAGSDGCGQAGGHGREGRPRDAARHRAGHLRRARRRSRLDRLLPQGGAGKYVSCSPFRVPVARLAAAQAAIEEKQGATFRDK